ncbi:hypothetical protein BOH66_02960 [Microbacterium aurum]|uniref:HTH deoR-type domain-containing protein n=1 Tax=Microbacterium aurum TaxID=36805 RepID=A0A1P8U5G9_9MICO|nr:DeoR/GlpR family DNA-binding transcription regulator [Microbacterium aurum]APZ33352.1 hypothetical protein BOH66_02960 [Microbacterium aurum]MBM7826999.1 DeoR/GlpR family transcriptional regulator of sugar metabolism [Microbacterium aurum]
MRNAERRADILRHLEDRGQATVVDLSGRYGVSDMTIRRDLDALQAGGRVQRSHGAVSLARTIGAEPRYAAKQQVNAPLKARIARYAAENLVDDGDVLLLEGGTTVTAMIQHLRDRRNLTVVTNGLYTANELSFLVPQVTVLSSGGILRDMSFTYVGPQAEAFFDGFHGNTAFVSATGLTLDRGFTDPNPLEAAVRKKMVAAADRVIALLDSSKFGEASLVPVAAATGVDVLVTDAGAPAADIRALRRGGVDVRVVD